MLTYNTLPLQLHLPILILVGDSRVTASHPSRATFSESEDGAHGKALFTSLLMFLLLYASTSTNCNRRASRHSHFVYTACQWRKILCLHIQTDPHYIRSSSSLIVIQCSPDILFFWAFHLHPLVTLSPTAHPYPAGDHVGVGVMKGLLDVDGGDASGLDLTALIPFVLGFLIFCRLDWIRIKMPSPVSPTR